MKKIVVFRAVAMLAAVGLLFSFSSCATTSGAGSGDTHAGKLAAPLNVQISVAGRWATISWNAVPHADGYIVHAESVGCGSGNRICDTATHTFTTHAGDALSSTYPTNGSVEFLSATSIRIWLMAATSGDTTLPMATQLNAKVKAVSTDDDSLDSNYSRVASISKARYQAADAHSDAHADNGGHADTGAHGH